MKCFEESILAQCTMHLICKIFTKYFTWVTDSGQPNTSNKE